MKFTRQIAHDPSPPIECRTPANVCFYSVCIKHDEFPSREELLAGGVIMAFVGVGVFFISLTDPVTTPTVSFGPLLIQPAPNNAPATILGFSSSQIVQSFKSTAMLIFIEAIAWFLLRQYRALIEDYKSFYRYYMRRANYLIALKLVTEPAGQSLQTRFVETLLGEELSGRLQQGQTTEGLEGQRVIDGNFAETVVNKSSEVLQRFVNKDPTTSR